ncbi:hypothetical protein LCGC14_2627090, partial [marine sediment metagenome]
MRNEGDIGNKGKTLKDLEGWTQTI